MYSATSAMQKKREVRNPQNIREDRNQHPAHAPPKMSMHTRSVRYAERTRLLFGISDTR